MSRAPLTGLLLALALLIAAAWLLYPHHAPPPSVARPAPPAARSSSAAEPVAAGDRLPVPPEPGATHPISSMLNIRAPMHYGDFVWNDRGVPAGPVWVRVDLPTQIMSVFRGGQEIGTTVVLYGADKKPTPIGSFPILAKLKQHRSSLYDAPMPYTLRLTGDGVSIHGSNVRWGAATHGCIGVPLEFAEKLFPQVAVGDAVIIVGDSNGAPPPPPAGAPAV